MHLPQNFAAKSGFPYLVDVKISDACPFGCPFCFVPETKILTERGEIKIEEIKVGEKIYSFNEETQALEVDNVSEVMERLVDEDIFEIELEDGTVLLVTKEHPFFVEGGWVEANELEIGMSLHGF